MSDELLLTLLWLLPLIGAAVVLALPERAAAMIKGLSLGVTIVTLRAHARGAFDLRLSGFARRRTVVRARADQSNRGTRRRR